MAKDSVHKTHRTARKAPTGARNKEVAQVESAKKLGERFIN